MNPDLGLDFYSALFRKLKELYPGLKLHALGPPEIVFLSKKEKLSYYDVLTRLMEAGLDSLPGAGAEILSDRVRRIVSPAKATAGEWTEVMREAHKINLPTSATMMYGHVETIAERIEHLVRIRDLQAEKHKEQYGFITFIPWPFQDKGTVLSEKSGIKSSYNGPDYLRLISISRIILNNVKNIQASLLTVGKEIAMLSQCLNDSLINNDEEKCCRPNRFDADEIRSTARRQDLSLKEGIRNTNLSTGNSVNAEIKNLY
jgi:cyclic dehypoxanthinyl futalosine synthase